MIVRRFVLTLLALFLIVPTPASASVIYGLTASFREDDNSNQISVSGQIDFMGDLSTDGTFSLALSDISAFDMTVTCSDADVPGGCFPDVVYALSNLSSLPIDPDYKVAGGELFEIDLLAIKGVFTLDVGFIDGAGTLDTLLFLQHNTSGDSCALNASDSCRGPYTLARLVPEPAMGQLIAIGLLGLGLRRTSRRRDREG